MQITEVEIPQSNAGRKSLPNPLLDIVKDRNENRGKATAITLTGKTVEDVEAAVKTYTRDLTRAGKTLNVTVRRSVSGEGKERTIVFWVLDKIVKERKEKQPQQLEER